MEFELSIQKANVKNLKLTLQQQRAQHIVAQYETKKSLRCTLPPPRPARAPSNILIRTTTPNPNPILNPIPRLNSMATDIAKSDLQQATLDIVNERKRVSHTLTQN